MRLPAENSIDPGPPFADVSWFQLVPDDPEKPKPTNDLGFFIGLAGFHAIPSAFATA